MQNQSAFFTEVTAGHHPGIAEHGCAIWTVGSCFADEIGRRMAEAMFSVRVNPCGTLYNPLSIADTLLRIAHAHRYTEQDLFEHNGLWHCMDFHSSFSGPDRREVLDRINDTIMRLHAELPSLRLLTLTFGSARAFTDITDGKTAANCHKLPQSRFRTVDLTPEEIAGAVGKAVGTLRHIAPSLKVIYTVSPIRHKAYGFHADKLSKASLLLAADRLVTDDADAFYFPAYEIMTDELRDYRFYAADMIHPSQVACDHIYNRFAEAFFTPDTRRMAESATRLSRRLSHRPMNPRGNEYTLFIEGTLAEAAALRSQYPPMAQAIDMATDRFISAQQNLTHNNGIPTK